MKNNILITLVIIICIGGLSFYAGMKYQQNQQALISAPRFRNQGSAASNQQGRIRMGGRPIVGEILNMDDKTITVKMPDGSFKIVLFSDTTSISKTSEAVKSDLKIGEKIGIFGTDNSDGTVTAQNIQLNPAFRQATNSGGAEK